MSDRKSSLLLNDMRGTQQRFVPAQLGRSLTVEPMVPHFVHREGEDEIHTEIHQIRAAMKAMKRSHISAMRWDDAICMDSSEIEPKASIRATENTHTIHWNKIMRADPEAHSHNSWLCLQDQGKADQLR
jgi:hypothetical protein